ncbi:MAG: hypothetical protein KKA65_05555 [Nanoarchaeota archaeon]|nr:hypothetical protein [Nanoarchaeota archaeon]MBU4241856.1 hypothetical protein [Nanoarchaeota archaeon]MBU4351828.1 hypothetical protein [Nanoarchaeota archaeon]MBU4456936.1 hypothetical protein [Nanoarchaeota archaeon]
MKIRIVLSVIFLLLFGIFLSGCAIGPKEGSTIDQISNLEGEYVLDLDRFLEEYGIAFEQSYDTTLKINDGLTKFSELSSKKTALKDTTNQIKNLADQGFSESNNNLEKEYFESVSKCYTERIKILDNTEEVIKNYQKSLRYLLHAAVIKKTFSELLIQIDSYTIFTGKGDVENSIKVLNEILSKIKTIKDSTIAGKEEISLRYQDKLIQWADQYNEIIDLSKQGWQKTGSERETLFAQADEKAAKMGESLNSAEVEEQEKNWYYENIGKLDSASASSFNEANRQCNKAADKYKELYLQ